MRDSRSLLLLLVSFLLIVVSFSLMWTWGFRVYVKNAQQGQSPQQITLDSAAIANQLRDSILNEYKISLKDLDVQLDSTLYQSDSLKNELGMKLQDFYRLRNEITTIINNQNANKDLKAAKQKLGELQNKMLDFNDKNTEVAEANSKIQNAIVDLNNNKSKTTGAKINDTDNKSNSEPEAISFSAFTVSDIRMTAFAIDSDKETETNGAQKTDKITASFSVSNFNSPLTNAEIFVVLLQPNGKVLKNSGWDSGTFITRDGKKIYSSKFNFVYTRGEAKRLSFSIKTSDVEPGIYTLEIYANGVLIGRALKTLS